MKNLSYITLVKAIAVLTIAILVSSWPNQALGQTPSIVFTADRHVIRGGECVNIFWNVTNVQQVYYNGAPVAGENQIRNECPGESTMYYLDVLLPNGQVVTKAQGVWVIGGTPRPVIRFWSDRSVIRLGECVNISWHVQNVKEVYYKGRPVVGENQNRRECPRSTRVYDLITIKGNNRPVLKTLTIQVN
jgi:hypothetical protein